ncbi:outer membrane autotransporter protein [Constrictibacter sp. MBR-5]|uniref:autotransporter domain-containing protein n=1 Tax=Constrictibacter sp. MBR-5 TaxID=3156467 RepID=UPI0033915813
MNRTRYLRALSAGAAIGLVLASVEASAQAIDFVTIMDESGSMGGEQDFIRQLVPDLDAALAGRGRADNQYGLVGYGAGNPAPRKFPIGGNDLGSVADFVAASNALQTSGGFEDGYDGIDFALNNIAYRQGSDRFLLLVTDEDRDNGKPALTFASIQTALQASNARLFGIVNQQITTPQGQEAMLTDGTNAYVADGQGGFVKVAGVTLVQGFDTTQADYVDLILQQQGGGCVADLNVLRQGGLFATSFAAALQDCLGDAIAQGDDARPLVSIVGSMTSMAMFAIRTHTNHIGLRLTGRRDGYDRLVTPAQQTARANPEANAPAVRTAMAGDNSFVQIGSTDPVGFSAMQGASANDMATIASALQVAQAATGGEMIPLFSTSNWLGYASVSLDVGDRSTTANQFGYDFRAINATVGVDRTFGNFLVGAAVGYSNFSSDYKNLNGEMDTDSYLAMVYGSYAFAGTGYLDATLGAAYNEYDYNRGTAAGAPATLSGDTDGWQWGGSLRGGYDFMFADNALALGPFAEARYTDVTVKGYTEGGGAGALNVDKDSVDSLTGQIGVRAAYSIQTDFGMFVPRASLAYEHEFLDDSRSISARLAGGGAPFSGSTDDEDDNYYLASVGVSTQLGPDMTAALDYTALLGHSEFDNHNFMFRLRWAFGSEYHN